MLVKLQQELMQMKMAAKIIDGRKIAENIVNGIKERLSESGQKPGIALVLVGSSAASEIYVNSKEKKGLEAGLHVERYNLDESSKQDDLLKLISELNNNPKIHGILVQLPLPRHIDESLVTNSILPHKDVDGFTAVNLGNLASGNVVHAPATARACMKLIESTKARLEGKNAVVVGRSNIVGKPVALMLLEKNATVTVCHSRTGNLEEHTKNADILVVAVGKPKIITKSMVKKGAVVIDVGINKIKKKIVGDVDFEGVKEVAGFITPVPGGVGPMTIACLMENTYNAMKFSKKLKKYRKKCQNSA